MRDNIGASEGLAVEQRDRAGIIVVVEGAGIVVEGAMVVVDRAASVVCKAARVVEIQSFASNIVESACILANSDEHPVVLLTAQGTSAHVSFHIVLTEA